MADPFEAVRVEGADAPGRAIIVCEHASNALPAPWGDLGLTAAQRQAHIAWDPGALGLARGLARRLDAALVHATVSRLVCDLNRPPHAPSAMPARSEVHDIPGNRALTAADRLARIRALHVPFHAALAALLAERLAIGAAPVLLTVHSFTPVFHGTRRTVELGVIHDADPTLARAIAARPCGLEARLNAPYSAADGVTYMLARHATPHGMPHAMLEVRSDLIADEPAQQAMAARLAPVLADAISGPRGGA